MSRLAKLKAATSLNDVATMLGFKPKSVSYILYKLPAPQKYTAFQIPKRSGGQRTIKAPVDRLKGLQRKLADLLQDCLDEINTARKIKDRTAHGFKRKRSIITNARQHRHRRWVFNIDLEDFFPSINFGRVRGFLIKNRDFALQPNVATVIAQIACHDNSLPQGSPCSPVVSNLVAHLLDMRLVKLAGSAACTYSRYADDLTFSTNKKEFPPEIATPSGDDGPEAHLWLPGEALRDVIERTGFRINAKKTHFMYRTSRQEVTGLVVNKKINVRWKYRHDVRAMVNKLVTTGAFEVYGAVHKDGKVTMEKRPGTPNELHGMLGFIDGIDVYNALYTNDKPSGTFSSKELVYREFLMYSTFYAAQTPVIVCEGDTDNVYLTHAIRSLVAKFPTLAEVTADNKILPVLSGLNRAHMLDKCRSERAEHSGGFCFDFASTRASRFGSPRAGATPAPGSPPGSPKAPKRGVAPARSGVVARDAGAAQNAAPFGASAMSVVLTDDCKRDQPPRTRAPARNARLTRKIPAARGVSQASPEALAPGLAHRDPAKNRINVRRGAHEENARCLVWGPTSP